MMTMCVYVLMICVGMPCHIHANKMSDRNIVFFLKKYLTKKIGFILTINGKTTIQNFRSLCTIYATQFYRFIHFGKVNMGTW